jgi:hypothetical protein
MAIYRCTGCDHDTNTTFVDMIADRGPLACTVIRCVGRYVPDAINVVEHGCAYDSAPDDVRAFVEFAIARNAECAGRALVSRSVPVHEQQAREATA